MSHLRRFLQIVVGRTPHSPGWLSQLSEGGVQAGCSGVKIGYKALYPPLPHAEHQEDQVEYWKASLQGNLMASSSGFCLLAFSGSLA